MRFRLNGYRLPRVTEVGAGPEGAIGHEELEQTLARMLSARARSTLVYKTKAPGDPTLEPPTAGPAVSNLIGPIDGYITGPIGEHVGLWSDFCGYGGRDVSIPAFEETTCVRSDGYIGLSDLSAQISTIANDNVFGLAGTVVKAGRAPRFMTMTPATAPNHQPYAPGIEGGGYAYTLYGLYAFLADRVGVKIGVEPGEGDQNFKRFNYRFEGGVFALNSDAGWLQLGWTLRAGNDMTPIVAGVPGVTALTKGQLGYTGESAGRARRAMYSVGYGFTDRGPHSFVATANLSLETDEYTDGGSSRLRATGTNLRYCFQRKYGVDAYVYGFPKWEYTDPTGVTHPIPENTGVMGRLMYSPGLNLTLYIEGANTQSARLDQDWRQGSYWSVNAQFLW
ncbi:MAG TPA: hypothetical protein VLV16_00805 [Gemmatimonadales bacterium]|nr:hypothetical protein [Gemmatimonadales bacterium]